VPAPNRDILPCGEKRAEPPVTNGLITSGGALPTGQSEHAVCHSATPSGGCFAGSRPAVQGRSFRPAKHRGAPSIAALGPDDQIFLPDPRPAQMFRNGELGLFSLPSVIRGARRNSEWDPLGAG
jgi:hypothetical protein